MNKDFQSLRILIIFLLIFLFFFLTININVIHPTIIIIIILLYSCLICLKISIWKSNYIYSIILFLIIIRGLLIIFLYFSRLISNEQITFKFNKFLISSFIVNFFIILSLIINSFHLLPIKQNFIEITSIYTLNKKNFQNILNLYEYPLNNLTIITIIYLLLSLFIIIKICSSKSLPLRKIN